MQPPPKPGRGWTAFSVIGIALWVAAMVLAGVLSDDPTDPKPTLIAFVAGGSLFFGLMFAAALWQQLRWRAEDPESRFGKRVAIGYSITGAVVTGLGLAAIARAGFVGGSVAVFIVPLVAIVVVWALVAVVLLRRYSARGDLG